ncbi:hypothetical protein UA08_08524 [Talaromyces atroroseus]|uniref:Transcription factor domain-containing protein n=1 Tax=Talaromyces atroroseus TaxID=1441469 RepID=A0A1Q5Q872_TALAT|nr:hypothetical protein UA08_08524 [Talaromyces atroroseus]OKL56252.1 hypothetical protein UA08_08524 [Talaromyces atroroseus]
MRLMLGQERSSKGSIRTLGTIEALLLISEWHPRSLHFPPESDAWDSDIDVGGTTTPSQPESSSNQWLQDVIEPARRSDQMSWMLLGSAFSLAHELCIFEPEERIPHPSHQPIPNLVSHNKVRKQRVQQLLYVYINQLSSRIGCMSLMPQNLSRVIGNLQHVFDDNSEWSTFMDSWMDLTKLTRSVNDMLFPSASFAKQQIHSGRYIGLLDHFRPLLTQWRARHLDSPVGLSANFVNILHIEYHYVRVYTHSFGMQAVVERILADSSTNPVSSNNNNTVDPTSTAQATTTEINLDPIDHEFIEEVIDGSCQILKKVIELAQADKLRFSPVRIFLRVTSSSIFLLKALSLGVRHTKLQESFDILERSIQALRSNILDDVHLASRYAILLEVHLSRLRRNMVASSSSSSTMAPKVVGGIGGPITAAAGGGGASLSGRNSTRQSSTQPLLFRGGDMGVEGLRNYGINNNSNDNMSEDAVIAASSSSSIVNEDSLPVVNDNDWLFSLPFDPSMAPFGPGGGQLSGFDGGTLDFLWNLPE